jgi:hypothetical protein
MVSILLLHHYLIFMCLLLRNYRLLELWKDDLGGLAMDQLSFSNGCLIRLLRLFGILYRRLRLSGFANLDLMVYGLW